jgi:hypothetical protein
MKTALSLTPSPLSTKPRYCHSTRLEMSFGREGFDTRHSNISASNWTSDRCLLVLLLKKSAIRMKHPFKTLFKRLFKRAKDGIDADGTRCPGFIHAQPYFGAPDKHASLTGKQNGSQKDERRGSSSKVSPLIFRHTPIDM